MLISKLNSHEGNQLLGWGTKIFFHYFFFFFFISPYVKSSGKSF